MNPNDYQQYALIIDFFSDPALNEDLNRFRELLIRSLPPATKICDVGGGTGYLLNLILQKRNDLSATLIEPAQSMYCLAEAQFPSSCATLINATLEESLPSLEPQNAFIFCRSLYALSDKIEHYEDIFSQLADNLLPFGQLFIFEISQMYNIPVFKKNMEAKLHYKNKSLNQYWPTIELALLRFNDGVTNGKFTLFSVAQLEALANKTGFDLLYYSTPNIYCFRKRYQHSH